MSDKEEERKEEEENDSGSMGSGDEEEEEGVDPLLPPQKKFEFEHEKKQKKITQKRQKQMRKEIILKTIDNNQPPKLCGGVDVYLLTVSKFLPEKSHVGEDDEGKKSTSHSSSKSFYVRMEISWPRDIYSAVQKSPAEKFDPDLPDTVDWGAWKYKNVAVYQRGSEEVKNAWMKYPKLIFTLKSKGKLFNTSISQAEVLLGPTVIEPKPNEDKNDQEFSVPLLTSDGEVRGELSLRIKYQSCARKK